MPQTKRSALKLDFYSLQLRLVWANSRVVEERFREGLSLSGEAETVAWFIEKGSVEVTYERETVRAEAGEWLFLRAGKGHQRFAPESRVLSIRFQLLFRGGKPLFERAKDRVLRGERALAILTVARRLVAEFERVEEAGTLYVARERLALLDNFRIETAFMAWLGAYVETMLVQGERDLALGKRDDRVVKALELIEDHRMRDKFSEAELARACGLSVNQLGRLFRAEQGVSPFQYYESRRLDLARHALTESSLPVKEVAFELGFSSAPHFSNWFSEHAGMSPRIWRSRGV